MALGSYRGPSDAGMFLRYAAAYAKDAGEREMYRVYVTDCLMALVGAGKRYEEYVRPPADFDAEEVIADVIARCG